MPKKSMPKRNTSMTESIRNGAKGISLFMLKYFRKKTKRKREMSPPIQKESRTAAYPEARPSRKPAPSMSLASPKPIHLPRETSQIRAKGAATRGPAKKDIKEGMTKKSPKEDFETKRKRPESMTKAKTSAAGI